MGFLPLPGLRSSAPHGRVLAGKSPSSHRAAFLIHPGVSPVPAVPKSCNPSLSHIHKDLFYYFSTPTKPTPTFCCGQNLLSLRGGHWTSLEFTPPKASQPSGSTKSLENKKKEKELRGGRKESAGEPVIIFSRSHYPRAYSTIGIWRGCAMI